MILFLGWRKAFESWVRMYPEKARERLPDGRYTGVAHVTKAAEVYGYSNIEHIVFGPGWKDLPISEVEEIVRIQSIKQMQIGYFGVPGTNIATMTHVVWAQGTLCGYIPAKRYEFQFCTRAMDIQYIECSNCKRRLTTMKEKINASK